jgi:hypothetical protein
VSGPVQRVTAGDVFGVLVTLVGVFVVAYAVLVGASGGC